MILGIFIVLCVLIFLFVKTGNLSLDSAFILIGITYVLIFNSLGKEVIVEESITNIETKISEIDSVIE